MMQTKGIVDVIVRDKDTLEEISRTTYTNMILNSALLAMVNGGKFSGEIMLSGSTIPMDRMNDYLQSSALLPKGYNESTTPSPQWFDANGPTPAYVQYKQRFDPPAPGTTRTINTVLLTNLVTASVSTLSGNTNNVNPNASSITPFAGFVLPTPCTQTDTQVLDIYYRIQYVVPAVPAMNPMHLYRAAKFTNTLTTYGYPDSIHTSAFKVTADSTRTTVALPYRISGSTDLYKHFPYDTELGAYANAPDNRLYKQKMTWSLPLAKDVGKIIGSYLFTVGTNYLYENAGAITSASGFTGTSRIQPVHNHNSSAAVPFIDVNTLANGSGSIVPTEDAGGWTSTSKYPEMYKVNITAGGDVGTSTYNFKVRRTLGFYGNVFDNRHEVVPFFTDEANFQNYSTGKTHGVVTSPTADLGERYDIDTVITADATGITKANIVNGQFHSWDSTTSPALPVTSVVDMRYDANTKTIWVACSATGLYKVSADSPYTVSKVANPPAPANASKCYAIGFGYNNTVWAVFDGALCSTQDSGNTWTAYHPASTPAFSVAGISDNNWATVRSMVCDKISSTNQMLLIRDNNTAVNPSLGSVWWSTAAPSTTTTARFWRVVFQNSVSGAAPGVGTTPRITVTQFKNAAGTNLSTGGTAVSSLTTTAAANAFDQTGATYWESSSARNSTAYWIGYDFGVGAAVNIRQVSFKVYSTSTAETNVFSTLQFSNDGVTWETSAYLGTAAATVIDSRSFNWTVGSTYNLTALTAWPATASGPNITAARKVRSSVKSGNYHTGFVSYDYTNGSNMRLLQFGSGLQTDLYSAWSTYASQSGSLTVFREIDPVSQKWLFGRLRANSDGTSGATTAGVLMYTQFRDDLGELVYGSNITTQTNFPTISTQTTTTGRAIVIFPYDGTTINTPVTGRFIYMGKGIVSYLRTQSMVAGEVNKYPFMATGQILTGNASMDGNALSPVVWDSYGWDGTQWVLNGTGSKVTHADSQALLNGILLKFQNAASGTSFSAGDYYNFGVCEGVWKDNATTINGSYSFYYTGAKFNVSTFSAPTVQLYSPPTGAGTAFWYTRGVTLDSTKTKPTATSTAFVSMAQLLVGDFEVQFNVQAGTGTTPTQMMGIVPADLSGIPVQTSLANNISPFVATSSTTAYSFSGSLNSTLYAKVKGNAQVGTGKTLLATSTYSIKRVGGVVTFSVDGVVVNTVSGTEPTLAYRPYVGLSMSPGTTVLPLPTANVVSNGSVYAVLCGSSADSAGVYDPNFYAVDDSTLSTFTMSLNGNPVTAKYAGYTSSNPNVGEIVIDGRSGIVFFNASDAGKSITGSYTVITY